MKNLDSRFNDALNVMLYDINDSRLNDIDIIAVDYLISDGFYYFNDETMADFIKIIDQYNDGLLTDSETIDKVEELGIIEEFNTYNIWHYGLSDAFDEFILHSDLIDKEDLWKYKDQSESEILYDVFKYDGDVYIDVDNDLFIVVN